MAEAFFQGEFRRAVDDRFRLSLPGELLVGLDGEPPEVILAKERLGCLSLWPARQWQQRLEGDVALIRDKIRAGRMDGRLDDVQRLGRLLSTRQRSVKLAGRGRLVLPEGFREFLRVEPGGELMVIGAAICIELWHPDAWLSYLKRNMPKFRRLYDQLAS